MSTLLVKKDEDTAVILVHYLAKRIGEVKPGKDIREWKWLDIKIFFLMKMQRHIP